MRFLGILLLLHLFADPLFGQSIRLLDIVQKPGEKTMVDVQIGPQGGYASFDRVYRSGCVGGYKVKVTFSKSLELIQPGETFQLTLNCETCHTPCGYKWRNATFNDSNNVRSIDQYPNYVYNGNLLKIDSSNGANDVNDFQPGKRTNVITLKYEPKRDVPLTAFQLEFAGEHQVFFVFSTNRGVEPPPNHAVAGKPNLTCKWQSTHGDIDWQGGYYGRQSKTIQGELKLRGGKWVYEGTWGRTSGSRWGKVYFEFTGPNEFVGYWTEKDGSKQNKWTGSGTCLLIKE